MSVRAAKAVGSFPLVVMPIEQQPCPGEWKNWAGRWEKSPNLWLDPYRRARPTPASFPTAAGLLPWKTRTTSRRRC